MARTPAPAIVVATLTAALWLNQGASLASTERLAHRVFVERTASLFESARYPFAFLYRRSGDEELYYATACAILGRPVDPALANHRGRAPSEYALGPPADGRWHRPYAEVALEYPDTALPWILAPAAFACSFQAFAEGFGLLMAACLVGAIAIAVGVASSGGQEVASSGGESEAPGSRSLRGDGRRAARVERWWLASALLLAQGGLAVQRLDAAIALSLAIALWAAVARRPWAFGLALGYAAASKLVPIVLLPLVLAADWRSWRSPRALASLVAGVSFPLVATFGSMWMMSPDACQRVVGYHAQRGLQVESTLAIVIGTARWLRGKAAPAELSFGSMNLTGPLPDAAARWCTFLLAAAVAASTVWFARRPPPASAAERRDRLALAMVAGCALVWLFGKVFSPQYLTWALPLVLAVSGPSGRKITWTLIAVMAVTQLYLRGYYDLVFGQTGVGLATLTVRQGLIAWMAALAIAPRVRRDGRAAAVPS